MSTCFIAYLSLIPYLLGATRPVENGATGPVPTIKLHGTHPHSERRSQELKTTQKRKGREPVFNSKEDRAMDLQRPIPINMVPSDGKPTMAINWFKPTEDEVKYVDQDAPFTEFGEAGILGDAVRDLGKAADGMKWWSAQALERMHEEQQVYDRFGETMKLHGQNPAVSLRKKLLAEIMGKEKTRMKIMDQAAHRETLFDEKDIANHTWHAGEPEYSLESLGEQDQLEGQLLDVINGKSHAKEPEFQVQESPNGFDELDDEEEEENKNPWDKVLQPSPKEERSRRMRHVAPNGRANPFSSETAEEFKEQEKQEHQRYAGFNALDADSGLATGDKYCRELPGYAGHCFDQDNQICQCPSQESGSSMYNPYQAANLGINYSGMSSAGLGDYDQPTGSYGVGNYSGDDFWNRQQRS